MPRYLLAMYQPDGPPPPPEVLEPIMADIGAVTAEMQAAGAWLFAGGLHSPTTATVLKLANGKVLVTDGPYAESKESIGGFTIIEAPGLEAAIAWGEKLARAVRLLPIEVRAFRDDTSPPAGR
jgi:hypothetical protein